MPTIVQRETRALAGVELRAGTDGKPSAIIGYAAKFNVRSEVMGPRGFRFVEIIRPGAFAKSLARGDDVIAAREHEPCLIIGRRSAGTLRLTEDNVGLRYEIDLPDSSVGRDVAVSVQRRDLQGSSFAFDTVTDSWSIDPENQEIDLRELIEVNLFDVAPVAFPAYKDATCDVRSISDRATARTSGGGLEQLDLRLRMAKIA